MHGKITKYSKEKVIGKNYHKLTTLNLTYDNGDQLTEKHITHCPKTAYYSKNKALAAFEPIKVFKKFQLRTRGLIIHENPLGFLEAITRNWEKI